MRNNLDDWLQLLRIASCLCLLASAWNISQTSSPLGITGQYQPIIESLTENFYNQYKPKACTLPELKKYSKFTLATLFFIAALTSLRCGFKRKTKYTLPVFLSGSILVIASIKYGHYSGNEIISIIPLLLPIATPFLLLSYRCLANKIDHWNYYANFLCVTTIFGNAFTYIFSPDKVQRFNASALNSLGIPISSAETMLTTFSLTAIFFALLTALNTTRRLGLFALISIGLISSIYRTIALALNNQIDMSYHLILADALFYTSYWLIPLLILLSLASRRKTQTLKL